MFSQSAFYPLRMQWSDMRLYFFVLLFAVGNLLLPQLCHLIPSGGQMFLPIYFFTLVSAYKFGLKVGLLTALLSPMLNYLLFAMPPSVALPYILIKSGLLALIAAYVGNAFDRISLLHLACVVLSYQLVGTLLEWTLTGNFGAATSDFTIGIPGMIIQVVGGWLLLKNLASYDKN